MGTDSWKRARPPRWIALGIGAAIVVIGGFLYYRAYADLEHRVSLAITRQQQSAEALEEMNRRLWTEIQLLQSELDLLDSDLRREGFEWTRAGSHDRGEPPNARTDRREDPP